MIELKKKIITKYTAINVNDGIAAQINETVRQGNNVPNKKTINMPEVADIPANAIKIPRIDGSL